MKNFITLRQTKSIHRAICSAATVGIATYGNSSQSLFGQARSAPSQQLKSTALRAIAGVAVLLSALTVAPAHAQYLVNTFNASGVKNGPPNATTFIIPASTEWKVSQLETYHWDNGQGTPAVGSIHLFVVAGQFIQLVGNYPALGIAGQGGVRNANWLANVNLTLASGKYIVTDDSPATMSWNAQSGGMGFLRVTGAQQPAPSMYLVNTFNSFGVSNAPPFISSFVVPPNQTFNVTQLITYHWDNGLGTPAAGSIQLFTAAGTLLVSVQAAGSPGQGGVPNAGWVANTNITIGPGTYFVNDTRQATRSWNQQSGGMGFLRVVGTM